MISFFFFKSWGEHVHHVQIVLQCFLKNSFFVKAEKCEFHVPSVSFLGYIASHGNIQMDPATVSAVTSWPVPDSHKQLQRFLGFANPSERNYDIVNRVLLVVKLALEDWKHSLEGNKHSLLVWTDHSKLESIHTAKRLNSRQALWSLFSNCFDFCLSYRPGSHNAKPDALSRQFAEREESTTGSEIIHPAPCRVTWLIERLSMSSRRLGDEGVYAGDRQGRQWVINLGIAGAISEH